MDRTGKASGTRFVISWSNGVYPRFWVGVWCEFCGDTPRMKGGCIGCGALRKRLERCISKVFDGKSWRQWRKILARDPSLCPIAADWVDEASLPEVAEQLRKFKGIT